MDSSVLIAQLRNEDTRAVGVLRGLDLAKTPILVPDLVVMDVLRGARDERTARRIQADLRRFRVAEIGGPDAALHAAGLYRQLRALGITIRSSVDVLIGAFCLREDHTLLHQDRHDFAPMQQHLGLRCL